MIMCLVEAKIVSGFECSGVRRIRTGYYGREPGATYGNETLTRVRTRTDVCQLLKGEMLLVVPSTLFSKFKPWNGTSCMTRTWKSPNSKAQPHACTGRVDAIRTHSLFRIAVFVFFCKLKPLLSGEARDGCYYSFENPRHVVPRKRGFQICWRFPSQQPRVIPPHLQQKALGL